MIRYLPKNIKLNNLTILFCCLLFLLVSIGLYFRQGSYFNNYFVVDSLNILFLLILAVVFTGVGIYNLGYMNNPKVPVDTHTKYSIGVLLFVFSMAGAILSNNLGLSWVFVEATTLTSAYLIYFNRNKQAVEAVWKYVFICSIGISLAFVGIILLLIGTGSLNSLFYDDLYAHAAKINPLWLKFSFVFILVGFGTKIGLAPVHSWLPDAHSEAPSPISALLSATLLNSAFLILLRFYKLMELANLGGYAKILLIIMGLMSVFITAVFVFNINNYKRMLAYSSIENMGIATLGIAVGGMGIYAAMLHILAHSLIKSSFFMTAGNILKLFETKSINDISGIIQKDPITGWFWVFCFLGLAGVPPSPIFISELILIREMFIKHQFLLAFTLLVLLTIILYGIGRAVIKMSFGEPINTEQKQFSFLMYVPQTVFITLFMMLGIYIPPYINTLLNNARLIP